MSVSVLYNFVDTASCWSKNAVFTTTCNWLGVIHRIFNARKLQFSATVRRQMSDDVFSIFDGTPASDRKLMDRHAPGHSVYTL